MNEQRAREIFGEELRKVGALGLAQMIEDGSDNSLGGVAAIAAMQRIANEVADQVRGQIGAEI